MTPIVPGPFHPQVFIEQFELGMKRTMDEAEDLFALTYATWEHKPPFDKEVEAGPNKVTGSTTTTDPIYGYVSRGTSVRYATMTPDFEAKTKPRVLGSGPGRGGVAYISRNRPRPGIEARNFEQEVKRIIKPVFKSHMEWARDEAAKKSGHGL